MIETLQVVYGEIECVHCKGYTKAQFTFILGMENSECDMTTLLMVSDDQPSFSGGRGYVV
jgi:hypothetical protein